jgi:Rha family phage regulatory protein
VALEPIVRLESGRVVTNSRDVADYFKKEHWHVLEKIDDLIKTEPMLGAPTFRGTSYLDESNRQSRCFDMDRDGFCEVRQ